MFWFLVFNYKFHLIMALYICNIVYQMHDVFFFQCYNIVIYQFRTKYSHSANICCEKPLTSSHCCVPGLLFSRQNYVRNVLESLVIVACDNNRNLVHLETSSLTKQVIFKNRFIECERVRGVNIILICLTLARLLNNILSVHKTQP